MTLIVMYIYCVYQNLDSHAMLADGRQSHIALLNALECTRCSAKVTID